MFLGFLHVKIDDLCYVLQLKWSTFSVKTIYFPYFPIFPFHVQFQCAVNTGIRKWPWYLMVSSKDFEEYSKCTLRRIIQKHELLITEKYDNHGWKVLLSFLMSTMSIFSNKFHLPQVATWQLSTLLLMKAKWQELARKSASTTPNSFILHYVNMMYYCIRFTFGKKTKRQLTPCCVLTWKVCVPGRLFFFPSPVAHKLLLSQPSSYLKPLSGLQWHLKYKS